MPEADAPDESENEKARERRLQLARLGALARRGQVYGGQRSVAAIADFLLQHGALPAALVQQVPTEHVPASQADDDSEQPPPPQPQQVTAQLVVELDAESFESRVLDGGEPWLIFLYATRHCNRTLGLANHRWIADGVVWFECSYSRSCGFSAHMLREAEEVAKRVTHSGKFHVGRIEGPQFEVLCRQHDVRGFPTVKLYMKGQEDKVFRGYRSADALIAFANQHIRSAPSVSEKVAAVDGGVVVLNSHNFDKMVKRGIWVISLYVAGIDWRTPSGHHRSQSGRMTLYSVAPWCSYCKELAPQWQLMTNMVYNERMGVFVGRVDCTIHRSLARRLNITKFPTIYLYVG